MLSINKQAMKSNLSLPHKEALEAAQQQPQAVNYSKQLTDIKRILGGISVLEERRLKELAEKNRKAELQKQKDAEDEAAKKEADEQGNESPETVTQENGVGHMAGPQAPHQQGNPNSDSVV